MPVGSQHRPGRRGRVPVATSARQVGLSPAAGGGPLAEPSAARARGRVSGTRPEPYQRRGAAGTVRAAPEHVGGTRPPRRYRDPGRRHHGPVPALIVPTVGGLGRPGPVAGRRHRRHPTAPITPLVASEPAVRADHRHTGS